MNHNPRSFSPKGERMYRAIKRGYGADPRAAEIAARTVQARASAGARGLVNGADPAADALYAAAYVAGCGGTGAASDELPPDLSDEACAWIDAHRAEFRLMVKTWR